MPESSISRSTRERLQNTLFIERVTPRRYRLRELAVQGQPLPDLEARVSPASALLGLDGILGRDFFARYVMVTWEPHSGPGTDLLRLFPL